MKHVIMGTAGHVDHGKTALVQALTGIDTDRLGEEKQRGLTIELGFAPFAMPEGGQLSIIDVPGHEKFIKNMVAGIMGIDLVLLVIAADEGIMPQTREHVDIINLLGVRQGVVALTKSDLVDNDWMEMVAEEVREFLGSTSLAGAPLVPVSAKTGEGIPRLVEIIAAEANRASATVGDGVFRLPVDRVFIMEGHGTVVTGTIYGGSIQRGSQVVILPQNHTAKVRSIQVHGRKLDEASAGERCALNLTGIASDMIKRGDTITYPGKLGPTRQFDAVMTSVPSSLVITHGQRVRLHLGTMEVMSRLRVIGTDDIAPGTKGYVQFYTEEPVVTSRGDRYIVRSYSPVTTIGGGQVLLPSAPRRRRHSIEDRRELEIEDQGSPGEILDIVLRRQRRQLPRGLTCITPLAAEELSHMADLPVHLVKEILSGADGVDIAGKHFAQEDYNSTVQAVSEALLSQQARAPFRLGIHREELKSTLFPHWERKDFGALLDVLAKEHIIFIEGPWVSEPQKYQRLMQADHPAVLQLEAAILQQGFQVHSAEEMATSLSMSVADAQDVIELLAHLGKIVHVGPGIALHITHFQQALAALGHHLTTRGSITVGEFRDSLQINRKLAVVLLEYLDTLNYTRRQGDGRVAGTRLPSLYTENRPGAM